METVASSALASWSLNWTVVSSLLALLTLYVRGWLRGRTLLRDERDITRLALFTAGLAALFIALASPLDVFDSLFLSAHMAQHLMLMMLAPPLILYGKPFLPLLRGLPRSFVKEGLGPFLAWPFAKRAGQFLVTPLVAWLIFALSTLGWHLPALYELALRSTTWHGIQHACFFWSGILFWWPIFESQKRFPSWYFIPYLLLADLVNTALAAFFVFSGKLLYPSYEAVQATGLKTLDDQVLAGLIMWVPGSLIYLVPGFLLAMKVFAGKPVTRASRVQRARGRRPAGSGWLARVAQHRRWLQALLLFIAIAVMIDGWFGRQVTPLNLAGTLPWLYWRALSVFALLLVGNLFCMVCPFVLVRDLGRKVLPANLRWPRALRNKWLASCLLLLYLWSYEAFGLWDSPWLTAWLIAGYFIGALTIDGLFRGASFCKYVCPIGQFHFVVSTLSPREIAVKRPAVCQTCTTFDCIKGNQISRGCELDLFQPKKIGNLDCTFCLDCVNSCPHGNVGLIAVIPAKTLLAEDYRSSIRRLGKRLDWIMLILIVTFGAFANAAGMIDPVMMWEHGWHAKLGIHSMPWIVAAFILLVTLIIPAPLVGLCGLLSVGMSTLQAIRKFAILLTPVGIGMWAAHVSYHALATLVTDVVPFEIMLLDAGFLLCCFLLWRATQGSLRLAIPWATLALAMYTAGLWIVFEPMQMRGRI